MEIFSKGVRVRSPDCDTCRPVWQRLRRRVARLKQQQLLRYLWFDRQWARQVFTDFVTGRLEHEFRSFYDYLGAFGRVPLEYEEADRVEDSDLVLHHEL